MRTPPALEAAFLLEVSHSGLFTHPKVELGCTDKAEEIDGSAVKNIGCRSRRFKIRFPQSTRWLRIPAALIPGHSTPASAFLFCLPPGTSAHRCTYIKAGKTHIHKIRILKICGWEAPRLKAREPRHQEENRETRSIK